MIARCFSVYSLMYLCSGMCFLAQTVEKKGLDEVAPKIEDKNLTHLQRQNLTRLVCDLYCDKDGHLWMALFFRKEYAPKERSWVATIVDNEGDTIHLDQPARFSKKEVRRKLKAFSDEVYKHSIPWESNGGVVQTVFQDMPLHVQDIVYNIRWKDRRGKRVLVKISLNRWLEERSKLLGRAKRGKKQEQRKGIDR